MRGSTEIVKLPGGVYDFHCHLRAGALMKTVARLHYESGVRVALAMPNLDPPIATGEQAVAYEEQLRKAEPRMKYLKTIYLTESSTGEQIAEASELGVVAAKLYPSGVTTNSAEGISSIERIYVPLRKMEDLGMVLNVHGESPDKSTTPFTAEKDFLPTFERICCDFPRLKVAFEHCTTREAVEMVNSFGSNVAATITLHHLQLVCSDWIGKNHGVNYCRPVAKLPADRELLREQVLCGNKKFFLGTDSAPHTEKAKVYGKHTPAGVYTGANVAAYAAHILESFGALNNLLNFCQSHGAHFYDIKLDTEPTFIQRIPHEIPEHIYFTDEGGSRQAVAPFMAGEKLSWRVITGDCRDPDVCIP